MSSNNLPSEPQLLHGLTSQDATALGSVRDTFQAGRANIVAGVILGIALIVGGILAALYLMDKEPPPQQSKGDRIGKYVLMLGLGVGAPIGGLVMLIWMKRLFGHRVLVGDNGIAYIYRGRTEIILWEQIAGVREVYTHESMKILKIPGASIRNIDRSLVIHRKDGKEFHFTVNSIKGVGRFADHLQAASQKHSLPWQTIEE